MKKDSEDSEKDLRSKSKKPLSVLVDKQSIDRPSFKGINLLNQASNEPHRMKTISSNDSSVEVKPSFSILQKIKKAVLTYGMERKDFEVQLYQILNNMDEAFKDKIEITAYPKSVMTFKKFVAE